MARSLLSTPSSGVTETLLALYRQRGYVSGNYVTAARVKRSLPDPTLVADITTVLDAQNGTNVTKSGSGYVLTAAGIAYVKAHREPRHSNFSV